MFSITLMINLILPVSVTDGIGLKNWGTVH